MLFFLLQKLRRTTRRRLQADNQHFGNELFGFIILVLGSSMRGSALVGGGMGRGDGVEILRPVPQTLTATERPHSLHDLSHKPAEPAAQCCHIWRPNSNIWASIQW